MMTIVNLADKPLKAAACGTCSGSSSDNTIRVQRETDPGVLMPDQTESMVMSVDVETNAA